MGDKISQEEIDAMLRAAAGDSSSSGEPSADSQQLPDNAPNAMELDILGEVYNISMGAAATAISAMISMKVDITTPLVEIVKKEDLVFQSLEPAVGVEITYTKGIEGINQFILGQIDVMKIVDILLGGPGVVDESTEFNEMHMSAIGEIMNQMMGSASQNLATFLNTMIDISVPQTFVIEGSGTHAFKNSPDGDYIIAAKFKLIVGDIINSEMITTSSIAFAKELINKAMISFGMVVETEVTNTNVESPKTREEEHASIVEEAKQKSQPYTPEAQQPQTMPMQQQQPVQQEMYPQQQPMQQQEVYPQQQPMQQQMYPQQPMQQQMYPQQQPMQQQMYPQQPMQQQMYPQQQPMQQPMQQQQMYPQQQPMQQQMYPQQYQQVQPMDNVVVQSARFIDFDNPNDVAGAYNNMGLILDLPLDVAVEIGRTKLPVNDVLELGEGYVITLDKQSSDPVDILINGNLIAKGSVVVIDENFCVRITEIVSTQDKLRAAKGRR